MQTVIIPTYNAGAGFGATLDALAKQSIWAQSQLVVIDSGSTDATVDVARQYGAKVMEIAPKDFDHGSTRNLAAGLLDAEFIIFLTQDAVCADQYTLERLIEALHQDKNVAVSYAKQLPRIDASAIEAFARSFNYPDTSMLKTKANLGHLGIRTYFCSNSCAAYRREIFEKLGGFQEAVGTNEDMLFAAKAIHAGFGVFYQAQARVFHSHDYTPALLWKRYFEIGRFFARNKWLLKSATGEARKVLFVGTSHFIKNKKFFTCLRFIFDILLRAIACRGGMLLAPKKGACVKTPVFSKKTGI